LIPPKIFAFSAKKQSRLILIDFIGFPNILTKILNPIGTPKLNYIRAPKI